MIIIEYYIGKIVSDDIFGRLFVYRDEDDFSFGPITLETAAASFPEIFLVRPKIWLYSPSAQMHTGDSIPIAIGDYLRVSYLA